jgi:hypothetical protein
VPTCQFLVICWPDGANSAIFAGGTGADVVEYIFEILRWVNLTQLVACNQAVILLR